MTPASTSSPHTMMVFVMMLFMTTMVVAAQPPEAAWDHAGLVNIYNYVGDSITVHCKDQFTDLKPQRIAHGADYTFKVQPNQEETTLYTCSFIWGLNTFQEFPVWRGSSYQDSSICGATASRKCLYKATQKGIFVATSSIPVSRPEGASTWALFRNWIIVAMSPRSPDSSWRSMESLQFHATNFSLLICWLAAKIVASWWSRKKTLAIATRSKEVNSIHCHYTTHFCRNSFVRPTQVVFFGVEINKLVQGAR